MIRQDGEQICIFCTRLTAKAVIPDAGLPPMPTAVRPEQRIDKPAAAARAALSRCERPPKL